MKHYGLIGDNLSHSFSATIHKQFFSAYNTTGAYDLLEIKENDLEKMLPTLKTLDGFNVTKPHKETIIKFIDTLHGDAQICKSVNTVKNINGKLHGFSTDGTGFLQALYGQGITATKHNFVLLGCGGVAKSIACALIKLGCNTFVYAPKSSRLNDFVKMFDGKVQQASIDKSQGDIIVNCTPVGQSQFVDQSPIERNVVTKAGFIFDTIYNPSETLLLKFARESGVPHCNGLDMLLLQAYEAQRIWHNSDLTQSKLYDTIKAIENIIIKGQK